MASTVAGGIFNAFAFAGASWIFSHVDHRNYQAEQKRHDLAVERMQKAQELWQRKEIELKDKIERQRLETQNANHDLQQGVDALDQYHKLLKEYDKLNQHKDRINDFNNYYQPSEKFEDYLSFVKIVIVAGVTYGVSRII